MIRTTKITDQVYLLRDRADCCSNLVLGEERALVFDTGAGVDDLHRAVRELTRLPLLVINSHGHFDHICGNMQFDTVYLAEEEFSVLERYDTGILNRWRRELADSETGEEKPQELMLPPNQWSCMRKLDFDHFDLGNLSCDVIALPGHTKGSVGIFIPRLRLLLSGDALTPVMCLNFENHLSRREQRRTLKQVCGLDFDYYLTSHHERAFPKASLNRMLDCVEKSENGRFYRYQYPNPPYARGWMYVGSIGDEPVAVVISEEEKQGICE